MPNNILITPGTATIDFSGSMAGNTLANTLRLQVLSDASVVITGSIGQIARFFSSGQVWVTSSAQSSIAAHQFTGSLGIVAFVGTASRVTDGAYLSEAQTFSALKTFSAGVALSNSDITGVNNITINDPGPNEGLLWAGGNLWRIYESPNDLTTDSGGNLQIVQNTTRRATFNTSGQLEVPIATGTAPFAVNSTTLVTNLNADLLDGYNTATLNTVNTVVVRDGSGNFSAGRIDVASVYDINDTNYYLDPASTSRLNILNLSGYGYVVGQTTNGQSFYQWEGATYRNPGDHTPSFLIRADNSTTGINGFRPALALYNANGADQTTVGLTFVSAEGATAAGNSVNLAGIIAKKEAAGTVGGWSPGSLTFFVKNYGTRVDAMYIGSDGRIGINTTDFSYTTSDNTPVVGSNTNNRVYINGSIQLLSNDDAIVIGRGAASFFKDEEIGFGWGGGWYMTDTTWIRARNNKNIYTTGTIRSDGDVRAPIFYDQDNTGYYVNPLSTSVLSKLNLAYPIYNTYATYDNTTNNQVKVWNGVLVAGSDSGAALTYTVIRTTVPQDSYMMGGFTIDWFENYGSTNAKTSIQLGGYWNAESNGGFIGWEMTTSNPYIRPTIQVARENATGNTVFILTHFSSSYNIIVARDLWLSYSGGAESYGYDWDIIQTNDISGYINRDTVVSRSSPATDGDGATGTWGISITGTAASETLQTVTARGQTSNQSLVVTGLRLTSTFDISTNDVYGNMRVIRNAGGGIADGMYIGYANAGSAITRIFGGGSTGGALEKYASYTYEPGSFRAPIFYDSDDTSYYLDPTNTTTSLYVRGGILTRSVINPSGIQWHDQIWLGRYDNVQTAAQYPAYLPGAAYGLHVNQSSDAMFVGLITRGASSNDYNAVIAWADDGGDILQFRFNNSEIAWMNTGGQLYVPILYDYNNSGYYLDPASTSNLNEVYSYSYRGNGNVGGTGNASWHPNGIYSAGYNWLYGGINGGGASGTNFGDLRANIFYDNQNTGYYADPNGSSQLSAVFANDWFRAQGCSGFYFQDYGRGVRSPECEGNPYGNITTYGGGRNGWQGWGIGSRHTFMSTGGDNVGVHDSSRGWIWYWNGTATYFDNGFTQFVGSARAPIFYDSNNTGYYADPASTSVFNAAYFYTIYNNTLGGGYYFTAGDWGWRHQTPSGWIQFGPANTSHAHIYTDRSNFYFNVDDSYLNGRRIIMENRWVSNTYYGTGGDVYATIWYDANNSGYYSDPNGTSRMNYMVPNRIKLVNNVNNEPRWDFSAYVVEAQHWYGNNSSMTMYLGESSGNGLQIVATPYASILYDRDNSAYYLDPNSNSRLHTARITNSSGYYSLLLGPDTLATNGSTSIYPDGDRYGLVLNAPYYPHLYINAYADSGNTTHGPVLSMTGILTSGGYRRFMMGIANRNPNEMSFGWYDNNYNPHYGVGINWGAAATIWYNTSHDFYTRNNIYSYTHYDRDNTGYYLNPDGGSRLSYIYLNGGDSYGAFYFYSNLGGYAGSLSSPGLQVYSSGNNSAFMSFHKGGYYAVNMGLDADTVLRIGGWSAAANRWELDMSGNNWVAGSSRAPIFYDSNNTGYYLNPDSTSFLYHLILSGASYFRPQTWIQFDGIYGLYWPNNFGAHLYPNNGSTHTQLRIDGQKNGYDGIWCSYSAVAGMMYDGGGNGGVYREANGRWYFYYYLPNACMGIGTSATSSAYGVYVIKGGYFDGRVDGTIFYDANDTSYYTDPNGTSHVNVVYGYNWYYRADGNYGFIGTNVYADTINSGYGGDPLELCYYRGAFTTTGGSMRAPIFYDNNDTSYYTDPNGYSQLSSGEANNYWRVARLTFTGIGGNSGQGANAYDIFQEGGGWSYPYPDLRIAYHTGIKMGANAGSYEGIRIYDDYPMSSLLIQLSGSSNYSFWYTWQYLTGHHGLYAGPNGAYFYPNDATYGSWRIQGSRNGWGGIQFDGGICLMMNQTEHGFYSTNYGWRLYLNGSVYSPGDVVAYWSDRRLKENIRPLAHGEGLDIITRLIPSRFTWKIDAGLVSDAIPAGTEEVSVIAQETQEVIPAAVKANLAGKKVSIDDTEITEYLTINYDKISPYLIQAIKDLKAEVDELKQLLKKVG
jgi:hypothetical protein